MKKVTLLFIFLGLMFPASADAVSNSVLITEVQTSGKNGATDEFVELFNMSSKTISGLSIKYITSSGRTTSLLAANVSVKSGMYKVFSKRGSGKSLGLYDKGGHIAVFSGNKILDKVGWGEALKPEGKSAEAAAKLESIARKKIADTDNNLKDFGATGEPTPGAKNKFPTVPATTAAAAQIQETTAAIPVSKKITVENTKKPDQKILGYSLSASLLVFIVLAFLYYKKSADWRINGGLFDRLFKKSERN